MKLPISSCYDYDGSTFICGVLCTLSQEALVTGPQLLSSLIAALLWLTPLLGGWPSLPAYFPASEPSPTLFALPDVLVSKPLKGLAPTQGLGV